MSSPLRPQPTTRAIQSVLAIIFTLLAVIVAMGFALLVSNAQGEGDVGSYRWFAYSGFPLITVIAIATFARLVVIAEKRGSGEG
ncbi:MAG: hypothetical protein OXR62_10340 [Ahrensia sp.]|nr:hypothetical protein [Ahrensia sp.]